MARVKLVFPEKLHSTIRLSIRVTDINYGNHLGNNALVGLLHEARLLWLAKAGFTELNIGGAGLIMSDLAVEYKSQAYWNENIDIAIACQNIARAAFEVYYKVSNEKDLVIAVAKTGMVCFDYTENKVVSIPDSFRDFLDNS